MQINNDSLFYTCSLIEYISRITYNKRSDVVNCLGKDLQRLYDYSDVFHCEPIEKVADDFINRDAIRKGHFDNISSCKYSIPDYWDIGEVFSHLIQDCYTETDFIHGIREVYDSWLSEKILNFNSDLYYQSREYLAVCYKEGTLLLN